MQGRVCESFSSLPQTAKNKYVPFEFWDEHTLSSYWFTAWWMITTQRAEQVDMDHKRRQTRPTHLQLRFSTGSENVGTKHSNNQLLLPSPVQYGGVVFEALTQRRGGDRELEVTTREHWANTRTHVGANECHQAAPLAFPVPLRQLAALSHASQALTHYYTWHDFIYVSYAF